MRSWVKTVCGQKAASAAKVVGFAALAGVTVVAAAAPALAGRGNVYTIGNYPVEASAADAVAAKQKAHNEGQQAALGALFKRLLPVTSYSALDRLKSANAFQLIDGVAIRRERNSRTRYIANLDFSFQKEAVRELLRQEGVPFIDEAAPSTVLVPLWLTDGNIAPAPRSWSSIWKILDLPNALTPLDVRAPPPNFQFLDLKMAADAAGQLATTLRANYVVLAIAEQNRASQTLEVTLVGEDPAGPMNWTRTYRFTDGDVGYAMELAAVVTLGVMEGRWKAARWDGTSPGSAGQTSLFSGSGPAGAGQGEPVTIKVMFSSLGEWNTLRGRILDMPGINDVRIGAVSPQSADVSLRYPGGGQSLGNAMARQGLLLINQGGFWQLRSAY